MTNEKARREQGGGLKSCEGGQPTEEQCKRPSDASQVEPRRLLIGSATRARDWIDGCPTSSNMVGWSQTLSAWVIISIRCKRWRCRHCGERKMIHYAHKVTNARPNRLVTLTVNPKRWDDPRHAYDGTRRALTQLSVKLRRCYEEFEYFRVLETTKKGWPHYHLVVRSPYIPQPEISEKWDKLTGAPIVDVRKIKKPSHVYKYIMKYLGKQESVPWTDRRLSWTRHFFVDDGFEKGPTLDILNSEWSNRSIAQELEWEYDGCVVEEYSRDCYIIHGKRKDNTTFGKVEGLGDPARSASSKDEKQMKVDPDC